MQNKHKDEGFELLSNTCTSKSTLQRDVLIQDNSQYGKNISNSTIMTHASGQTGID